MAARIVPPKKAKRPAAIPPQVGRATGHLWRNLRRMVGKIKRKAQLRVGSCDLTGLDLHRKRIEGAALGDTIPRLKRLATWKSRRCSAGIPKGGQSFLRANAVGARCLRMPPTFFGECRVFSCNRDPQIL